MELMFDTANLKTIMELSSIYPYVGVTCNPSIIKLEGKIDFYNHFREIRKIIGTNKSLHIQVVSRNVEDIIKEAQNITDNIDKDVYIKVPVTKEGLKAIKILKNKGFNVTATCIYTKMQGLLAIAAGADYIAPYYNRIEKMGEDPNDVISSFRKDIDRNNSKTKILAASFHKDQQITNAIDSGSHVVTLNPEILETSFNKDYIEKAVDVFTEDWISSQHTNNLL